MVVKPADTLTIAYQRMKLYDVSQLPVISDGKIVGIVDESDVLMHIHTDQTRFRDPVSTAMVSNLTFVDVADPVSVLMPIFDQGQVAIVMRQGDFLGLITRMDLLNYLRRKMA